MLKSVLCIAALCAVPVLTEDDEPRPHIAWMFPTITKHQLMAALSDNNVFVSGSDLMTDSQFYAFRKSDGQKLWQDGTGGPAIRQPVVSNGKVYSSAGSGGNFMTLNSFDADANTEQRNWLWNDPTTPPALQSSVAVSPDNNLVYIATNDLNKVFAIYLANTDSVTAGRTAWSRSISNGTSKAMPMPITPTYDPDTGLVFAATINILMAMNGTTGDPVWTYNGLNLTDSPLVVDGTLIAGAWKFDEVGIFAFNATNGIFLWYYKTQWTPSAPTVFQDGTNRVAFTVLPVPEGTDPGGVRVLSQPGLAFDGVTYGVDASLGAKSPTPRQNTTAVKYLEQADTWEMCRDGCKGAYCNVTSFIWYSAGDADWMHGCYCRIDGEWETSNNSTCISGRWSPPQMNWSYSDAESSDSIDAFWTAPIPSHTDSTVYVIAVNQTHEMLYALKEGFMQWSYAFELHSNTLIAPSVPAVCKENVVFASQNGTVICFTIAGNVPVPSNSTPWYRQAKWLVNIVVGAIAVCAMMLCYYLSKGRSGELDHTSPGRKYQVISKLGSGSYGVVYLVRRKSDKVLFALKYLSCDSDDAQERALLEFRTMRSYQGHPNMIKVVETFMNWSNSSDESDEKSEEPLLEDMKRFNSPKYVCLVMPFYRQGDLKQFALNYPDHIPEKLLLDFAAQIISLLQYLHDRDQPLIHRDLKPENILLADDMKSVVVTDFGLAKKMHNRYCATRAGTLCYMAPECWSHHYGKEADIWAAGCIMYSVASRRVEEHNIRVMFSEALQTECFQSQVWRVGWLQTLCHADC
eukprot:TRINITY_DN6850_c1_g1_i1.p1 TRINITY_DN6850_c1_g1~~TRINITY_DN6850_c1_g1_i1.p1  ORF type:complete len:800 (+),score=183.13 TRINITY_DN6850_c1_g1_i1:54-2453(+)